MAHDEQRPFVVQAGDVRCAPWARRSPCACGPEDVEVVVTEGVVEICAREDGTARIAAERVARNQEVVVTTAEQPIAAS